LVGGTIVKTGSGKLIDEINKDGFDKYIKVGEN
jgi:Fe-S cluster assembly ATPase SufC